MTITEFLLARIAEDEAEAQECLLPKNLVPYSDDRIPAVKPEEWGSLVDNYLGGPMGKHCARHDPSRVLAECKAKRAIIEQAQNATEAEKEYDDYEWQGTVSRSEPWTGDAILYALAAVFADHEDYDPEWATA
jgi:hypothetical protein